MKIGLSILLLAAGAVLAFAVHVAVAGVDLRAVGWILMAVGLLGLIISLVVFTPRRNSRVIESQTTGAGPTVTRTTETGPSNVNQTSGTELY